MIETEDATIAARCIQHAKLREGIVACLILVDTNDGSLATLMPQGVDPLKVLQMAVQHYEESTPAKALMIPPLSTPS